MKKWEKILMVFFFGCLILVFISLVMRMEKKAKEGFTIEVRKTESIEIGRVSMED